MNKRIAAYQALVDVVGEDFITDDSTICHAYSKDASLSSVWRKHKTDLSTIPGLVALPANTKEIQGILRICSFVPASTLPIRNGLT